MGLIFVFNHQLSLPFCRRLNLNVGLHFLGDAISVCTEIRQRGLGFFSGWLYFGGFVGQWFKVFRLARKQSIDRAPVEQATGGAFADEFGTLANLARCGANCTAKYSGCQWKLFWLGHCWPRTSVLLRTTRVNVIYVSTIRTLKKKTSNTLSLSRKYRNLSLRVLLGFDV